MATSSGAQLLVRMLMAEGVRHVFTLSGLHVAPIYAACVEEADCPLPTGYRTRARQPGDPQLIQQAARLIESAARVAVIGGSSVFWDDAARELAAFAERAGAPGYLNGAGRGALPFDHPHFFSQTRKDALAEADVVLVVGTPLDFRLGYGAGFGESAKIVQVDSDASEIGRNRSVEVGIVGDSRSVLAQLEAAVPQARKADGWLADLRKREGEKARRQAAFERSDQKPVHHFRLARELDEVARAAGDSMYV